MATISALPKSLTPTRVPVLVPVPPSTVPTIQADDARGMCLLMGELADLTGDPTAWKRHLLAGLCDLAGAPLGLLLEVEDFRAGRTPRVISWIDAGRLPSRPLMARALLDAPETAAALAGLARLSSHAGPGEQVLTRTRAALMTGLDGRGDPHAVRADHLFSARFDPISGSATVIILCRPAPAASTDPFSSVEAALIDMVHDAAPRPRGASCLAASVDLSGLPPRTRQVLDRLLVGDSEKQIAHNLNLSRHTVHDYIKGMYRRLHVNSRGELMARFIGPDANPAAPTGPARA